MLQDCQATKSIMATKGMHLQVEIRKKLNLWDWKISNIRLCVGNGQQPLQWLGYVACNYVAFENGIVTSKCIPQGIIVKEKLVDVEGIINEICQDEEKVIVEYSSGPESFTQCWEGQISEGEKRMRKSLIKIGYDMGENDEMYDLISEVDALVTKVVNLIYSVVEEVDEILHGKKVEIKYDKDGLPEDIVTTAITASGEDTSTSENPPEIQYQLDEDGNRILDEDGNPIPLPPPEPDPPKDEETYMEIALPFFEEWNYGILERIQLALSDMQGDASREEFRLMREVLKGHDAQLLAIFLWYGSKGAELHDKDFGFLTSEQWELMWKELNIPLEVLNSSLIKSLWQELKDIGQMTGCYQLNLYGFYAAIMHLTLDLYTGYNSTQELSSLLEMVAHFIEDILVPNFEFKIKTRLQTFYNIDASRYQSVYKEIEETIQDAIYGRHFIAEKIEEKKRKEKEAYEKEMKEKEAKEKGETKEPLPLELEPSPKPPQKKGPNDKEKEPIIMEDKCMQVIVPEEVKNLIPYFRKWKILGEIWDPEIATLTVIYALQTSPNMSEFQPLPTDELTFGMTELERMLTAASHAAYEKVPIKRVSEFSFFKSHLNECFQRGGLAKPLYSSYEQKKRYLASICLRYGGNPPPAPPVFEKK